MPCAVKTKPIKENNTVVSIITPLYNAGKFISQTLESIQNQTYPSWELFVIDDNSGDDSLQIAETFSENDKRIKIVKLPENKGTAHCRNLGTELANGNYIAFLDADDLWHPKKLEKQLDFMEQNSCNVSFTNYLHIDEDGNSLKKRIVALPQLSYKKQHHNNYVGNLTGIYNAAVLGKIFSPELRKRQDWALWLEAIKRNKKPALGLQEDLAYYRVRKNSMSRNKINLIKYNFLFYRMHLRNSVLVSVYYLLRFFWEYFLVRPKHIQKLKD